MDFFCYPNDLKNNYEEPKLIFSFTVNNQIVPATVFDPAVAAIPVSVFKFK